MVKSDVPLLLARSEHKMRIELFEARPPLW